MSDKSMPNKRNKIIRYSKEGVAAGLPESTLRAYTYSLDGIAIQIRTEEGFATAILSDARARVFAQYIIDAIEGHGHYPPHPGCNP